MYWTQDRSEIDGCIARLREDKQLQEQASEVCQQRIREDTEEIVLLEQELELLRLTV